MSRLLIRADGILADNWCPLDPEPPYQPPDRWDGPHVAHRFTEGIETLRRLPLGRWGPDAIYNTWPAYQSEWADLLAVVGDLDAVEVTWERRNHVRTLPSAAEISAMERSLGWPSAYLSDRSADLTRALNVTALARVRGVSVADIAKRGLSRVHHAIFRRVVASHAGVHSVPEWHRLAHEAADHIAWGLRTTRVAVF
jgi:hypothetical protein